METTGKISVKMDTQIVSEKFKKKEFVLTIGDQYPQEVIFELTQDKVGLIDKFNVGDEVKAYLNLRGKRWEKDGKVSYFNKLEVWKIEGVSLESTAQAANGSSQGDGLPF